MVATLWPLRNGPSVSEAAVLFALALERDDHALSVRGDQLLVSNGSTLKPEQWAGIKRHRKDILALLAYQAPEAR